jgi:hypothetical protein
VDTAGRKPDATGLDDNASRPDEEGAGTRRNRTETRWTEPRHHPTTTGRKLDATGLEWKPDRHEQNITRPDPDLDATGPRHRTSNARKRLDSTLTRPDQTVLYPASMSSFDLRLTGKATGHGLGIGIPLIIPPPPPPQSLVGANLAAHKCFRTILIGLLVGRWGGAKLHSMCYHTYGNRQHALATCHADPQPLAGRSVFWQSPECSATGNRVFITTPKI